MKTARTVLVVIGCLGVVAVLRSSALTDALPAKERSALPPAYHDLAALQEFNKERPSTIGVDTDGTLLLEQQVSRYGQSGLRIDLKVWNRSCMSRHVVPIDPLIYKPSFRDADGKELFVYGHPDIQLRGLRAYEIPLVPSANYLGGTYVLPDFYKRVAPSKGVQVRIEANSFYFPDDYPDGNPNTIRFKLASEWVTVPPP
jgi:hypothetical protein